MTDSPESYRAEYTDEEIEKGIFSTDYYGDRARGSYSREMYVEALEGQEAYISVGDEYHFHLDPDIVKDLIRVLQKVGKEEKE